MEFYSYDNMGGFRYPMGLPILNGMGFDFFVNFVIRFGTSLGSKILLRVGVPYPLPSLGHGRGKSETCLIFGHLLHKLPTP